MQAEFDKLPPHDLPAERAALASLILTGDDRESFAKIRRILWRTAFYQPDHQVILDAIDGISVSGKPVDALLLRSELERRQLLADVGGVAYIAEILQSVPSSAHGIQYANIVALRAVEREAGKTAAGLSARLNQPIQGDDARALIIRAAERLQRIASIGRDVTIWSVGEAVSRFLERRKQGLISWIPTGIEILDAEYQGILRQGGYTLVAARPSMGKSTWVRDLLRRQASTGIRCGLIAVEETEDKIAGNYLSSESNVENSRIAYDYAKWATWEHEEVDRAAGIVSALPICATDTAFSVGDVMAAAEAMYSQHKCQVIAVDHIHLIAGSRAESREQQISEISGALKEFIKRKGIVGVVAAQLNRPEKTLCPPPPALTDLRGSGALEEHADAVLMLHREDYYYRGKSGYTPNGLCQVLIRKNRNGCVGDVVMKADLAHQRFEIEQEPIPAWA